MQCSGESVVVVEMMPWLFQTFNCRGSVNSDFSSGREVEEPKQSVVEKKKHNKER